jgi:hypothetical protein
MKSLSGHERQRALEAIAVLALLHLNDAYSQEKALKKLEFGSVEAMRQQVENWRLPKWIVSPEHADDQKRREYCHIISHSALVNLSCEGHKKGGSSYTQIVCADPGWKAS